MAEGFSIVFTGPETSLANHSGIAAGVGVPDLQTSDHGLRRG